MFIRSRKDRTHGALMRCFAVFVGFWLWMMPQMLFSRSMLSFCEEHNTRPAPIAEEEEVHKAHAVNAIALKLGAQEKCRAGAPPSSDDAMILALHGEVPHPPPWG